MIGWKVALAAAAAASGVGLALVGEPGPEELARFKKTELDERIASRSVHLDPAEVLSLVRNEQIRLDLIDVRNQGDFNRFHLTDARRVDMAELRSGRARDELHPLALKIIMSNDEARAERAWRLITATGVRGAYVLEGGINLWLEIFREGHRDARWAVPSGRVEELRHHFDRALGGRHAWSRPELDAVAGRRFDEKAELLTKVRKLAGGCGG